MHVIWKRPDGFHSATPADFEVVEASEDVRIWLHKQDHLNFPFRISGGWQDEDATTRLNQIVNLLRQPKERWIQYLDEGFRNSNAESRSQYIAELRLWLLNLCDCLKGDFWEQTIMREVLQTLDRRLGQFVQAPQAAVSDE